MQLDKFDFVIYHLCTNDIGLRTKAKHLLSDYANLVAVSRKVNTHIKIVILAILPIPVDYKVSQSVIKEVSSYLNEFMRKDHPYHPYTPKAFYFSFVKVQ